jgi:hypothetical protein
MLIGVILLLDDGEDLIPRGGVEMIVLELQVVEFGCDALKCLVRGFF